MLNNVAWATTIGLAALTLGQPAFAQAARIGSTMRGADTLSDVTRIQFGQGDPLLLPRGGRGGPRPGGIGPGGGGPNPGFSVSPGPRPGGGPGPRFGGQGGRGPGPGPGFAGGPGYQGGDYRRHRGGYGYGGAAAGLAAGALIGGAIASQGYGYGYGYDNGFGNGYEYALPPPPPPDEDVVTDAGDDASYCAQRYRSYDPSSGTYLGYDGLRHPCP